MAFPHDAVCKKTLGERQNLLRATYDGAPVGLCLLDRELRYLEVNACLAEMNGVPIEAHIGRTLRDIVPQLADQVEPMYRRVLDTGEPIRRTLCTGVTLAHPHDPRDWLVTYHPVQGFGGTSGVINAALIVLTTLRSGTAGAGRWSGSGAAASRGCACG